MMLKHCGIPLLAVLQVTEVLDMTVREKADRGTHGQEKGNLKEGLTADNAWLEFEVR